MLKPQPCSNPSSATSSTKDFESWEDRLSDEVFTNIRNIGMVANSGVAIRWAGWTKSRGPPSSRQFFKNKFHLNAQSSV